MPTSYSTLLGLALPVQGELSGTWGDTVNDYITKYLDSAVAGVQTISGTQTAVTLSVTNGSTLVSAGAGATGSAQYMVINCTGTPASLLTISAPNASKVYVVINGTAQSVKLVGVTGPTTGVTLVTGEKAVCAWDGSDFVKVATSVADGVTSVGGTGTVNGVTLTGTVTSTGNLTLGGTLSGVSLTSQVSGILPVANGGTATATPALVAGTGVTISGTWPNQTINATGTGGTVTSVAGAGTVNGLTLTGTVTSSGSLTLGGTLSGVANAALTNSSVTVAAGTGMSGGGAVALGSSVTLTNAGVTSIVAGTGITISGATGAVTVSASGGAGFSAKTTNYTAASGDNILANTSAGTWTLTLPASPSTGNTVQVMDSNGTFDTYPLTVARNGQTIMGAAEDMTLSLEGVATTFVYNGSTWRVI